MAAADMGGRHSDQHAGYPMPTTLEELEETLRRAMLASDVATLESLIADDLIFGMHTGAVITKAMDLDAHRSGLLRLIALEPSEQRTARYGDTGVVSVRMHLVGEYDGATFAGSYRYLRVWAREGDRWQVVAGQVTAIAS
jgi:ketosteroid isomerase-like protein